MRDKAKDIIGILSNPTALRAKRRARNVMRSESLMMILNKTYDMQDGQENENVVRRDASLTLEPSARTASLEPVVRSKSHEFLHEDKKQFSFGDEAPVVRREDKGKGRAVPKEDNGKSRAVPREERKWSAKKDKDRVVHRDDADLLRAIEESKRTAEGTPGMTSEEADVYRALQLSLDDWEKSQSSGRSHAQTSGVGSSPRSGPSQQPKPHSAAPSTYVTIPSARCSSLTLACSPAPDLLIDVSVPDSNLTPQLQFLSASSSMSDVYSLQVSPPLPQVRFTTFVALRRPSAERPECNLQQPHNSPAFMTPPHVQLSPLQPQPYTPITVTSAPAQLSSYG